MMSRLFTKVCFNRRVESAFNLNISAPHQLLALCRRQYASTPLVSQQENQLGHAAGTDVQRCRKRSRRQYQTRDGRIGNENEKSWKLSKHASKLRQQQHVSYSKPKMQQFQAPFSAFISCLPGLEPLLLREVEYLRSQWSINDDKARNNANTGVPQILQGGVKIIVPSLHHLYILHLYLGTASHIYLRLNDDNVDGLPPLFRARGFPELQRKVKDLIISQRWNEWLTNNDNGHTGEEDSPINLQVHVITSKSKLMHTKAVEERLKQTIREVIPSIKDDDEEGSEQKAQSMIRLMARINRDVVQLSLDTSNTPLHRRGYRLKPYKAPLREDLANALLMSGGLMPCWDLRPQFGSVTTDSFITLERRESVLFDPCCGSGTIAIEGAAMQSGLPPGRFRPPPLEGTSFCNPALWEEMKSNALSVSKSAKEDNSICVAACDIDPKALDAAKANAKRAGVEHSIDFFKGSFVIHPFLKQQPNPPGQKSDSLDETKSLLVVANPPYGRRLSPNKRQNTIYRKLVNSLLSSSRSIDCAIIGSDVRVMRGSGMPLEVAYSTKHGGLNVVAMTGTLSK